MPLVVDPSVALAWILPDETSDAANNIRTEIEKGASAWIPAHWWLEIANGLLMAERRGRIAAEQVSQALSLLNSIPFEKDAETSAQIPTRTMALACKHNLTLYDAAYLELAQRRKARLATFDIQLLKAAAMEKVQTK